MLTEYSSYDDIRKFRDKVHAKYTEMKKGWLGKEIDRAMIKWRQANLLKGHFGGIERNFKVDNHLVELAIYPCGYRSGRINKNKFSFALGVSVETKKGKLYYTFPKSVNEIHVYTPHYLKRHKERFDCQFRTDIANQEIVPYVRNGRNYILRICSDSVMITRKIADDIIMYITFLHRNMCTSKNYQELFERAGKAIDEHDIYEWK